MTKLWQVTKTTTKWTGIAAVAGYVAICAGLYAVQRSLVFPKLADHVSAEAAGFPEAQEITLQTSDGERLLAWYVPPKAGKHLFIYFHGNGDTLNWRVERDRRIVADGDGLLALSYRGYEGSTGSPSEAGLRLDAEAAYAFATTKVAPEQVVVWGHSLGTGVAVGLAAERKIAALVLEAPYTSIADVAAARMPFLPIRLILSDPFHSDERIGKVTAPVLIFHGAKDDTIPISFGERLFGLVRTPKCFVRFPEGDHVNLDDQTILSNIRKVIARPFVQAAQRDGADACADAGAASRLRAL